MVGQRDGEQQLIVLAAIHSRRNQVHVELLGLDGGLVVDGYAVLVNAASHTRRLADVQQFARQSVTHIHHRRGVYAQLPQFSNHVATSLGF